MQSSNKTLNAAKIMIAPCADTGNLSFPAEIFCHRHYFGIGEGINRPGGRIQKGAKMLSVLIADDEFIEREGISFLLGQSLYEFRIYMAENGEEAMRCLERNDIDILLPISKCPLWMGWNYLFLQTRNSEA